MFIFVIAYNQNGIISLLFVNANSIIPKTSCFSWRVLLKALVHGSGLKASTLLKTNHNQPRHLLHNSKMKHHTLQFLSLVKPEWALITIASIHSGISRSPSHTQSVTHKDINTYRPTCLAVTHTKQRTMSISQMHQARDSTLIKSETAFNQLVQATAGQEGSVSGS